MNSIKIDMTHPLHLMLAIEFIAHLDKVVRFKADIGEGSFTTLHINVDKSTIEDMKGYINANS